MPLAINTNIFLQLQATSKYQRQQIIKTRGRLLQAYIFYIIRHNSRNGYSWTREIHTIRMMGINVYANSTISRLLGRPKNLFSFKVRQAICGGRLKRVICDICHKSNRIIQPTSPFFITKLLQIKGNERLAKFKIS